MLVKDLIEKLQQCDPWASVRVHTSITSSLFESEKALEKFCKSEANHLYTYALIQREVFNFLKSDTTDQKNIVSLIKDLQEQFKRRLQTIFIDLENKKIDRLNIEEAENIETVENDFNFVNLIRLEIEERILIKE